MYLKILDSPSARKGLTLDKVLGDLNIKAQHPWASHMTRVG